MKNGSLLRTPLPVLVRARCQARETCSILLEDEGKSGEVYIVDGQVVHARCGDVSGPEAFYAMTGWNHGIFTVTEDALAPAQTINLPWAQLLIESAKRALAAGFDEAAVDSEIPAEELAEFAEEETREAEAPGSDQLDQDLDLDSLMEIPGVTGAVVVAIDGTPVRAEPAEDASESQSALAALVGGAGDQLADLFMLGSFEQAAVTSGSRRMVLFKQGELYLGLYLSNQTSATLVSSRARQILGS